MDAEHVRRVLLVGDQDVDHGHDLAHDAAGFLAAPEVLAVVEVAGHGDAVGLCGLDRGERLPGRALGERRGDAGEVEPIRAGEHRVPIQVSRGDLRDGGALAVIDDLGRAHGDALFVEVDAHAAALARDPARVHAKGAQLVDGGVADGVCGQERDKGGIQAVVGQGDGRVGLRAAVDHVKAAGLGKALEPRRGETEHDLAECDDSLHCVPHPLRSRVESGLTTARRSRPRRRGAGCPSRRCRSSRAQSPRSPRCPGPGRWARRCRSSRSQRAS